MRDPMAPEMVDTKRLPSQLVLTGFSKGSPVRDPTWVVFADCLSGVWSACPPPGRQRSGFVARRRPAARGGDELHIENHPELLAGIL